MTQFLRALDRTPRRWASLYGLAFAATAAGDQAQAEKAAREFLDVWRRADPGRPELVDIRRLLEPGRP
jgi:cytochrome c-type biogenesis protein CcmH/NrfG